MTEHGSLDDGEQHDSFYKLVVRGDTTDPVAPNGDVYELPNGHQYEMGVNHDCGVDGCPADR